MIFNDTTLHFLKRLKRLFSESSNILLKHNNLVENCQLEQDLLLLHELSTQLRSCTLFGVTMATKEQMFLSKCSPQNCVCIFEVVDVPCLQHHTKAENLITQPSWVIKFVQGLISFGKIAVPPVHCVPYSNQCHKQAVCEVVF